MGYGDDVQHDSIIQVSDIEEFLRYVDDLTENAADEEMPQAERQNARDLLSEYDPEHLAQLRAMVKFSEDFGDTSAISENYFRTYSEDHFDDIYPGVPSQYVNYDSWVEDERSEFTEFTYDSVTYYMKG